MGVVNLNVTMKPTARLLQIVDEAKAKIAAQPAVSFDRPRVGSGIVELRVARAPKQLGLPSGWYAWGIVESYPNGHQEILLGGGKTTITEAAVEGSSALEALLTERG
jgi:hypothetical protein